MEYSILFVDHILDNIYGQIGITLVEKELEKKPIFKRLHHISQLGLANLVYPCALHNRYIHSIGVMYTAYNMALHINMNYAKKNNGNDFFNDTELQIIRLAGLLHDIGHYPMSHNIELAYKNVAKIKYDESLLISNQEDMLVNYPYFLKNDDTSDKFENYKKQFDKSSGYHHESIGKTIIENNEDIYEVVKDYFVKDNDYLLPKGCKKTSFDIEKATKHLLTFIGSIVAGDYSACNKTYNNNDYRYNKKYSAIIQLIHSELDADNLDYLMRDSTFSGTSYGELDISVLLNNLEVREIYEKQYIGSKNNKKIINKYLIGINKKGISSVDQFFINKFFSYSQIIYNKHVSSLEFMLLEWSKKFVLENAIYSIKYNKENKDINFLPLIESKKTKKEFINFTDSLILEEIHKNNKNTKTLYGYICSKLSSNLAFELDRKIENGEYIVVGNRDVIMDSLKKNSKLYKNYRKLIDSIASLEYSKLPEKRKIELFSYRFESHSITKQIKYEEIDELVNHKDINKEQIIYVNYCRLANGIPIFEENKKYSLTINRKCLINNNIPKLIVDHESSLLSKIYDYKFLSLRKYNISK